MADAAGGAGGGPGGAPGLKASSKHWLPVESNPPVMNKFLKKMGFPTELLRFCDVLSTEEWALSMLPPPVRAIMMLYPIKEAAEVHRREQAARIAADGQVVDPALFYTRQNIDNACGTIGLIHAVANLSTLTGGDIDLVPGSFLERYVRENLGKTPEERAEALEADEEVDEAHAEAAVQGQAPPVDDTNNHFICFVAKGGHLYEMDGRKATPVNHGPTTDETFAADAARVIREFMDRDPGELRFTMTALAAPGEDDEEEEAEEAEAAPAAAAAPEAAPAAAAAPASSDA